MVRLQREDFDIYRAFKVLDPSLTVTEKSERDSSNRDNDVALDSKTIGK